MPSIPIAFSIETVLKRDRLIVAAGLFGLSALTWAYMVYESRGMYLSGVCRCAGMKMSGPDVQPWQATTLIPLFLMWAQMMVAMMTPSAAPVILTFAMVNRKRRERADPFVPTAVFLLGYFALWTAFSVLAAVLQWVLHSTALLSPTMVNTSRLFGAGLLFGTGLFQWSPWKNSCLTQCRSPLNFLMTEWRDGAGGAFVMGLKHGSYCAGCCWFLMALLFVAGVMNIWWIAIISIVVLMEKIAPAGVWFSRICGTLLIAWGGWMAFHGTA